jgi:hypothetical protein
MKYMKTVYTSYAFTWNCSEMVKRVEKCDFWLAENFDTLGGPLNIVVMTWNFLHIIISKGRTLLGGETWEFQTLIFLGHPNV